MRWGDHVGAVLKLSALPAVGLAAADLVAGARLGDAVLALLFLPIVVAPAVFALLYPLTAISGRILGWPRAAEGPMGNGMPDMAILLVVLGVVLIPGFAVLAGMAAAGDTDSLEFCLTTTEAPGGLAIPWDHAADGRCRPDPVGLTLYLVPGSAILATPIALAAIGGRNLWLRCRRRAAAPGAGAGDCRAR